MNKVISLFEWKRIANSLWYRDMVNGCSVMLDFKQKGSNAKTLFIIPASYPGKSRHFKKVMWKCNVIAVEILD